MKKLSTLLLLFIPLLTAAQNKIWFTGTLDDAFHRAKIENKLILFDFSSKG